MNTVTSPIRYGYVFTLLLLLGAVTYVTAFHSDRIPDTQALLGLLTIVLGLFPALIACGIEEERRLIPLMPLHGIFYAVAYGVPVFSAETFWRSVPEETVTKAIFLTCAGVAVMYLGYYGSRRFMQRIREIRLPQNVSEGRLAAIGWGFLGVYLLFQYLPILSRLPSVGQLQEPLGYISTGILFCLSLQDRLKKFQKTILIFVVVPALFVSKLATGSLGPVMGLALFLSILYWQVKRRIPWLLVVPTILFLLLANPLKGEYRNRIWYGGEAIASHTDKALVYLDLMYNHYVEGVGRVQDNTSNMNRISCISTLAYVIHSTPDPVPYWMGGSYTTLFTSFIPRFMWPSKPEARIGQEFGHRYRLLGANDLTTSFNLPWLPEFYANFGGYGVIAGMFMVGILFRFLVQKFSVRQATVVENVLGLTLVFRLYFAESNFALMVGGIFLTFVTFYITLTLLCRN